MLQSQVNLTSVLKLALLQCIVKNLSKEMAAPLRAVAVFAFCYNGFKPILLEHSFFLEPPFPICMINSIKNNQGKFDKIKKAPPKLTLTPDMLCQARPAERWQSVFSCTNLHSISKAEWGSNAFFANLRLADS